MSAVLYQGPRLYVKESRKNLLNARFSLAHSTATRLSNAKSHPINPDTIFRSIIIQINKIRLQPVFIYKYANIQFLKA